MSADADTTQEWPCPTCGEEYDSQQTMRIHHARKHGERLVDEANCEHCGDTFEPSDGSGGKYCSLECVGAASSDRVEKTCRKCCDTFTAPPSRSDQQYCSKDCYLDDIKGRKHIQCPACDGWFQRYESEREGVYCSIPCRAETKTDRARPDDPEMLAWLLYVYEDNALWATYKRMNVAHDDSYTKKEVQEILRDLGVYKVQHATELHRRVKNGEISADDISAGEQA